MKWTVWATRGPEVFQTKRDHHAVWVVCPHKALLPLQLPEPTERWRAEVQYQLEGPTVSIFPMHIIVTKHKRDIIAEPCTLVTQHGSYLQLKEERIARNICWYLHFKKIFLKNINKYKWCHIEAYKARALWVGAYHEHWPICIRSHTPKVANWNKQDFSSSINIIPEQ